MNERELDERSLIIGRAKNHLGGKRIKQTNNDEAEEKKY